MASQEVSVNLTHVKICGITRKEDAISSLLAGADFIGFVLHPKSKRYIFPSKVRDIIKDFPFQNKVLVFAYNPISYIIEVLKICFFSYPNTYIQIPKDHPELSLLISLVGEEKIFPVLYVQEEKTLNSFSPHLFPLWILDHPPVKTQGETLFGGTGKKIPSHFLKNLPSTPFLLAGGIREENLEEVLSLKPWGIDLSSGVEKSPGIKDPEKVKSLIKKVKKL